MADEELDPSTRQAMQELQIRMIQGGNHLRKLSAQVSTYRRDGKRCALTLGELEGMEGGTRTYKAVGKSFVYFSKADLEKDLSESVAMCEGKVESLGKEAEVVQKQVQDVENQIRELLSGNPSLLRAVAQNVA